METTRAHTSEGSGTRRPYNVFDAACPSRAVLSDVAKRWAVLVLGALADGPARFGELAARIDGVSERMLSATLKTLRADGLVAHDERDATYALTPGGRAIAARSVELFEAIYEALERR